MLSMTGYGKAEYQENGISLAVEIKTVNNRNFDFNAKMPRSFIAFEDGIRKAVQAYVSRGRVELFINFTDLREKSSNIALNVGKAIDYYNASKELAEKLGLNNDLTTSMLLKMPEVLVDNSINDYSDLKDIILETTIKACENLNAMRKVEGEKLVLDLLSRIETVSEYRLKIQERAPLVVEEYKNKLKERIIEALGDIKYDEARLLNEVAFFTDKANIDEELTRLSSHIVQFKEIIKTKNCGKKLDFLMQEFNREANTICSKSNDVTVTSIALLLKNEIEKIREQVQNLE